VLRTLRPNNDRITTEYQLNYYKNYYRITTKYQLNYYRITIELQLFILFLVGLHNLLHKLVANDIFFVELHCGNAFDMTQHLH